MPRPNQIRRYRQRLRRHTEMQGCRRSRTEFDRAADQHADSTGLTNLQYAPLAEITDSSSTLLWIMARLLVVGRVIHMFSLSLKKPITAGRVVGMTGTWGNIGLGSVLALMHAAA